MLCTLREGRRTPTLTLPRRTRGGEKDRNIWAGRTFCSWLISNGVGVEDGAGLEFHAVVGIGAVVEAWQVGADEGVSQDVADGDEDIGFGLSEVAGERDGGAELVAGLVFENGGCDAEEGLPEELKGIFVGLEVFNHVEDGEIAEQGFDVALNLALLGVGFDDEVEPAAFEIELAVGHGEIVEGGDVEADETGGELECGFVGEGVELHIEFEPGLVHGHRLGVDGGEERGGSALNVGEIIDGGFELVEKDIDRPGFCVAAEMDGAVVDLETVEIEWEEVAEHLEPGPAGAGLGFRIVGRGDEVEFGLVHIYLADEFAVSDGVPLDGEFEFVAPEEGLGDDAGAFEDADVFDGVGAAPEVQIDVADAALVEEVS